MHTKSTYHKVILLPYAGGNRFCYQNLTSELDGFQIIPVELPGRGHRFNEPLLLDFDLAAHDIVSQITHINNLSPYCIYGHSLGALLALRVASILDNTPFKPTCIVVSGNAGPSTIERNNKHLLKDEQFLWELKKNGGTPTEFFDNEDLQQIFLPIIRADYELSECNNLMADIISVPILSIMGNEEEHVDLINNWQHFTTSKHDSVIMEGGHFFIHDNSKHIANLIDKWFTQNLQISVIP